MNKQKLPKATITTAEIQNIIQGLELKRNQAVVEITKKYNDDINEVNKNHRKIIDKFYVI